MSTAHASPITTALPTRVVAGAVGGLVGGVMFGILMQMMGMIPMVAMLVGSESVAVGWLVHLFNSALFGTIYGSGRGPTGSAPARVWAWCTG